MNSVLFWHIRKRKRTILESYPCTGIMDLAPPPSIAKVMWPVPWHCPLCPALGRSRILLIIGIISALCHFYFLFMILGMLLYVNFPCLSFYCVFLLLNSCRGKGVLENTMCMWTKMTSPFPQESFHLGGFLPRSTRGETLPAPRSFPLMALRPAEPPGAKYSLGEYLSNYRKATPTCSLLCFYFDPRALKKTAFSWKGEPSFL